MTCAPAKPGQNRLLLIAMLGFAILGSSLVIGLVPYQIDDAFITFRYARSLLQGHGFSFNPEGPWVEGFSSPVWLLLLAGLAGVFGHLAIPTLAIILGFLCYVLCMYWLCEPVAEEWGSDRRHLGNLLALAFFVTSPAVFFYSVTGLETLLFLLVLLIFARSASGSATLPAGILCGLAAAWVRPEGPWFLPMLLIQALIMAPRQFFRQRRFWFLAGSVVTGSALLAGSRLLLFGQLLPNTYFAKPMVVASAARYIRDSFLNGWALPLLLLALLGAIYGQRKHRGYFLAALSWVLAAFLEGGDWMVHGRMLVPAFGLLFLSVTGLHGLFGRKNLWRQIGQGAALISIVAACGFGVKEERDCHRYAQYAFAKTVYVEEMLAGWIKECRVRSVATVDIGMLGYYAPVSIFDLAGLTDTRIAHSPGAHLGKAFPLDYLFSEKRVDLIILRTSARPDTMAGNFKIRNTGSEVEYHLATDPRLSRDYRYIVGFFTVDEKYGWYGKLIFARTDIVIPDRLVPENRIIFLPARPAVSAVQSSSLTITGTSADGSDFSWVMTARTGPHLALGLPDSDHSTWASRRTKI
jgi:hypothetical protein